MDITAVYDPARRYVFVTVTGTTTEPTISRVDANGRAAVRKPGATWHHAAGSDSWRAYDREHAHTGPVRYLAAAGAASAFTDATGLEAVPVNPTLTNPLTSAADLDLLQVTGLTGTRTNTSTVHQIIGVAAPVVTFDVMTLRMGTLTLLVDSYETAAKVAGAADGSVLLLRQREHPGLDLYLTATGYGAVHAGTRYWTVDLPYAETVAPAGPALTIPAWTWATVAGEHASFAEVHAEYLTWSDLAQREGI